MRIRFLFFLAVALIGARPALARDGAPLLPYQVGSFPYLVESFPSGTSLDTSLPEAAGVWPGLIAQARDSINLAEFYVSDDPNAGSALTGVLDELRRAGTRGVRVRLLVDKGFYKTYPLWVNQLDSLVNIEARTLDYRAIAGGVLHAKYFVIDGRTGYLGSQNLDWRSLSHIQELGAVIGDTVDVAALGRVFARDWRRGVPVDSTRIERLPTGHGDASVAPALALSGNEWITRATPDGKLRWHFVASPKDDLPAGVDWELPRMIAMIDSARDSVAVQLLTYKPKSRSGEVWDELDGALRRAAARGARVRLLVSAWCKRKGTVEYLQELCAVPGVEIRFMNIPEAAEGFIPFARTVHAKYLVVDGVRFWLGTSNWERDYFYNTRNVGIIGEGVAVAGQLARFFRTSWDSPYAEVVKKDAVYTPPRIAE